MDLVPEFDGYAVSEETEDGLTEQEIFALRMMKNLLLLLMMRIMMMRIMMMRIMSVRKKKTKFIIF